MGWGSNWLRQGLSVFLRMYSSIHMPVKHVRLVHCIPHFAFMERTPDSRHDWVASWIQTALHQTSHDIFRIICWQNMVRLCLQRGVLLHQGDCSHAAPSIVIDLEHAIGRSRIPNLLVMLFQSSPHNF